MKPFADSERRQPPNNDVDSQKFRIAPVTCWSIAVIGGINTFWIALSFVIYLPIDESKVHPELFSKFDSSLRWTVFEEGDESGVYVSDWKIPPGPFSFTYRFPDVNDESRIMVIQKTYLAGIPPERTEVRLDEYSHTRRRVVRLIESNRISMWGDFDPAKLTSDPFARTRMTVCQGINQIRQKLGQ